MSKTILAVETSTAACSVALLYKDRVFKRYEVLPQKHAHRLLEMVDEVMTESALKGSSLDLLAFGEGPGAFTGVRIAAGVIQGLALGWDKPVVGISSLEAMAVSAFSTKKLTQPIAEQGSIAWCALMDARMKEVYLQSGLYDLQTGFLQAGIVELLSPEEAGRRIDALGEKCIAMGDVQKEYPELTERFLDWTAILPSAESVAILARQSQIQANSLHEHVPVPIYLRNHVADTIEERKLKKSMK